MNRPADPLDFTQEEQGRMLARVYASILSDQFTGNPIQTPQAAGNMTTRKQKQTRKNTQTVDAPIFTPQELAP